LTKTYHKNGACYAINRNFLLDCEKEATPIGEKSSYVITEDMISIDKEEDFQRVEKIINSISKSINEFIRTSA
jgi:CMP-N-acetylneuraminic acid synthetase